MLTKCLVVESKEAQTVLMRKCQNYHVYENCAGKRLRISTSSVLSTRVRDAHVQERTIREIANLTI